MNSKQRRKLLKKGYSRAAANEAWRKFYKNLDDDNRTIKPEGMAFDVFLAGQPDHVLEIFYQDLQQEGSREEYVAIVIAEIAKRAEKLLVTQ